MKKYIYADHAATTRLADEALEAMLPWLRDDYGNPSQPYSFSRKAKKALSDAREIIASCIGAQPNEIFFTSGGTESDNWAIKGAALSRAREETLLTTAFEHHAVERAVEAIERMGNPAVRMLPSAAGRIEPETLSKHLSGRISMVSIMLANNELGTIQPIQSLCAIAHEYGSIFHTDAVQAVGHIPIDTEELGIDLLSASSHKFNGPKGVGFLYIRHGTEIQSYANGGSQEHGMRAGTENVAGIVGMAAALKLNCENMRENAAHIRDLELRLLTALKNENVVYQRNGVTPFLPGLMSLSFPGFDGEAILHCMDLMGIAISTGSACDSVNTEISHVLKAIRMNEKFAKGTIRISLGKENTAEEVDRIAAALRKIVARQPDFQSNAN